MMVGSFQYIGAKSWASSLCSPGVATVLPLTWHNRAQGGPSPHCTQMQAAGKHGPNPSSNARGAVGVVRLTQIRWKGQLHAARQQDPLHHPLPPALLLREQASTLQRSHPSLLRGKREMLTFPLKVSSSRQG